MLADAALADQTDLAVERAQQPARGLVAGSAPLAFQADLPQLPRWMARGPERIGDRRLPEPVLGFGISLDEREARAAAVAEVVERVAALEPPADHTTLRAPFVSLGDDALAPTAFALYAPHQLADQERVTPLTETLPIDWRWAYSLTRRRQVLLPAAFVHLALVRRGPNTFLAEGTATGTACHVSAPHATLAALCEVIERDALAAAWLARVRLAAVEVAGTPAAQIIDGPLARCEATFELYQIPSDSPFPVMLAAATSQRHPCAAVGAGCRPDGFAAASRAVLEAAQVRSWLQYRPPRHPATVRTFADHADMYASADGAALLRSFLSGAAPHPRAGALGCASEPAEFQIASAVEHLAASGHEVVVADLTTQAIEDTGFRVVRVVATRMIDVNADSRWPRLGGCRAQDLPVRVGTADKPLTSSELNSLPVPLA